MTEDTLQLPPVISDAEVTARFEAYLEEARAVTAIVYGARPAA